MILLVTFVLTLLIVLPFIFIIGWYIPKQCRIKGVSIRNVTLVKRCLLLLTLPLYTSFIHIYSDPNIWYVTFTSARYAPFGQVALFPKLMEGLFHIYFILTTFFILSLLFSTIKLVKPSKWFNTLQVIFQFPPILVIKNFLDFGWVMFLERALEDAKDHYASLRTPSLALPPLLEYYIWCSFALIVFVLIMVLSIVSLVKAYGYVAVYVYNNWDVEWGMAGARAVQVEEVEMEVISGVGIV
jgi:hypothetical protein